MLDFQHSFANPQQIARFYAKMAIRALYNEVALYPKPGLVSFIDQGAHEDMDGALFFRSLFSLRHYFFSLGLHAALNYSPKQLVPFGLQAEQTMLHVTQGINTHRGAIFSLGILCATVCKLSTKKNLFSLDELHQSIINDWSLYLRDHHQNKNTHGTWVKEQYAAEDAKSLAINGYKLVFELYKELIHIPYDKTFLGLLAYQHFLLKMDDINILYRVGPEGLLFARQQIQGVISLQDKKNSIQAAIAIHHLFSEKNISPGGVADMLSLFYFLYSIFSGTHS